MNHTHLSEIDEEDFYLQSHEGKKLNAKKANCDGMNIEILQTTEHAGYLGRALRLVATHDEELQYRISKAWSKFGLMKQDMADKHNRFLVGESRLGRWML